MSPGGDLFAGVGDGPKVLPAAMRRRLLSEVADGDLITRLAATDRSRPLPPALRDRLVATLVAGDTDMPRGLRRRLEATVVGAPAARPVVAIAAALTLLLGALSVGLVGEGGPADRAATPEEEAPGATAGRTAGDSAFGSSSGGGEGSAQVAGWRRVPTTSDAGLSPAAPGVPTLPPGAGPAPPFAFDPACEACVAGGGPAHPGPPPAARPPLRIGVVGAGTDVAASFEAYVARVNASGGVRSRRIELVPTAAADPALDVIAVVNLGSEPVAAPGGAPAWVGAPLFEGPDVEEAALHGSVFSFTSVIERQAHLAALAAFPVSPLGSKAVIYRAKDGVYADRVPTALEQTLDGLGVFVVTTAFDPGRPVFLPADAAFVSLPTDHVAAFVAAAGARRYAPARGTWGVASLFDETLLEDFGSSTRVASPYQPASAQEMQALRADVGGAINTDHVHGWVTAKMLAVAVWNTDAGTGAALQEAVTALVGYRAAFMAPYEMRAGGNSRTPEAIVLRVDAGAFQPVGEFVRDP